MVVVLCLYGKYEASPSLYHDINTCRFRSGIRATVLRGLSQHVVNPPSSRSNSPASSIKPIGKRLMLRRERWGYWLEFLRGNAVNL